MNYNIQALRALAAYAVVFHHIIFTLRDYLGLAKTDITAGASGVPVFFVISGYIMMYVTERKPSSPTQFFKNRIIRIAPIYWLLTVLAAVMIYNGAAVFGLRSVDTKSLLTSLFFVPNLNSDNGVTDPIVYVGWSLNYEMMFYVIFSICLMCRTTTKRLSWLAIAIVALWLCGFVASGLFIDYLSADIILGFVAGAIIWRLTATFSLPNKLSFSLLLASFVGLLLPEVFPYLKHVGHHDLLTILSAFAMVLGAVSLENAGRSIGNGFVSDQGNASYSLYLIHPFVLQLAGKIAVLVPTFHKA